MRSTPSRTAVLGLAAFALMSSSGCAAVGNILFAPHPASLRSGDAKLALTDETGTNCVHEPARAAGVPPEVVGLAVVAVERLLAAEAERYEATYWATASGALVGAGDFTCVRFRRDSNVTFEAEFQKKPLTIRVKNGRFHAEGVKSKVVSWPVRTLLKAQNPLAGEKWHQVVGNIVGFVNPLMILHWVWGLFEDDFYKVDFAVKLRIEAVDPQRRKLVEVGEVAIPVGKLSIDEMAAGHGVRGGLETGLLPQPAGEEVPVNVTLTVLEANDLGDAIARGADLVGDEKTDVVDALQELLGLK